jgi:hypothetical protein
MIWTLGCRFTSQNLNSLLARQPHSTLLAVRPSPQKRPQATLKRIYVQRGPDGSLNFTFSSFQRPYNQQLGTIHYIGSIDSESLVAESGLKVGQRILRVNGNPISSCRHKEVRWREIGLLRQAVMNTVKLSSCSVQSGAL